MERARQRERERQIEGERERKEREREKRMKMKQEPVEKSFTVSTEEVIRKNREGWVKENKEFKFH